MLRTFDIDDVEEGMFIDSIANQQGKFKITSPGRITSLAVIKQLKKKGILSVVVDTSKQLTPEVVEQQEPDPSVEPTVEPATEIPPEPPKEVSFEAELEVATKLHSEGKDIQRTILEGASKNVPIDIAIPEHSPTTLYLLLIETQMP